MRNRIFNNTRPPHPLDKIPLHEQRDYLDYMEDQRLDYMEDQRQMRSQRDAEQMRSQRDAERILNMAAMLFWFSMGALLATVVLIW